MKSPWHEIDRAFAPMFDEEVALIAQDGRRTTARCAVFDDWTGDPLADGMMDTQRRDVHFVVRREDWPFAKTLKRGAKAERADGSEWSVYEVREDASLGLVLDARSM